MMGDQDTAERLRCVTITEGPSHENLSRICRAVYPEATGWTRESCEALRDRLEELIGGDECNFSTPKSYTDAVNGESRPAETPDGSESGVTSDTWSITTELRTWVALRMADNVADTLRHIADRIDWQFDRTCAQHERALQDTLEQVSEAHENELAELRAKLDEMDTSGATELYKLLKRTLGEAKNVRDKLSAHAKTLREVEEERDDALMRIEEAKRKLRLDEEALDRWVEADDGYLDLIRDAAEDYQRLKQLYDTTREVMMTWRVRQEERCIELPRDSDGELVHFNDLMKPHGALPGGRVTCIKYYNPNRAFIGLTGNGEGEPRNFFFGTDIYHITDDEHDTAEDIVRELTMGSITETEAIERIGMLNGKD